jgi:hypothetical protein
MTVRTDVPIHLHPASLAGVSDVLDQKDTLGTNVMVLAREALQTVHDTYAALNDAETALRHAQPPGKEQKRMVNGVPTFYAATKELGQAAENRWNAVAPVIDRQVKQLNGIQEVLTKRVNEALEDTNRKTPEGLSLAAEVRAHVKALPQEDRSKFVLDAINAGDKRTVAALLHAQPFLSGLSQDAQDTLRAHASMKFSPLDYPQLTATKDVIRKVQTAGSVLLGRYQRAIDLSKSPAAVAAQKVRELAGG